MIDKPAYVNAHVVHALMDSLAYFDRIGPEVWNGCVCYFDLEGRPFHDPLKQPGRNAMPIAGQLMLTLHDECNRPSLSWWWWDGTGGRVGSIVDSIKRIFVRDGEMVVESTWKDEPTLSLPIRGDMPDTLTRAIIKPRAKQATLEAFA